MKKIIKLELKKSLTNKFFFLSILIGCGITVLSLIYNISAYYNDLQTLSTFSSSVIYNPRTPAYTVFNSWIGGEPFSLGTSIYFFVFPLLIALPYGWSYCEEKKIGYTRNIIPYTGKTAYHVSKYITVFLSGGLAMVIPLLFNLFITMMVFPSVTPLVTYDIYYGVFGNSLLSSLYYTHPFIYVFLYLLIDFVYCGLIACICLTTSSFTKQRWIAVIIPFFCCLFTNFACKFVYTSSTTVYKQISPLYFLRPVETLYPASWTIILVSAFVIFIVTFFISIIWERTHEIY